MSPYPMLRVIFSCYVLVIGGVSGMITQQPLNVATDVSGETFFNCTSDRPNTNYILWIYTKDGDILINPTDLTENNCTIRKEYMDNFRTENPVGGNVCNLIIFNATLLLGGFYSCTDGIGGGTSSSQSILVVVDSETDFLYNETKAIISGMDVMISKIVTYDGPSMIPPPQIPTLAPSFYWTFLSDKTGNITSYSEQTESSSSSYIVVTANGSSIPVCVCNLIFNSPVNPPLACAVNAPTYTKNWTTDPSPDRNINQFSASPMCGNVGMSDAECMVFVVFMVILFLNILLTIIFLAFCILSKVFHKILSERFEWMDRMLPCFNKRCECSAWIVAFIAMSIVTGFITFPVLIMMAYCSCCNKNKTTSKEESLDL